MSPLPAIEPAEILTVIPYSLGFMPDHSMVAVALTCGADGISAATAVHRVDLVPEENGTALTEWAAAHTADADAIVCVCYCEDPRRGAQLAVAVGEGLTCAVASLVVCGGGWFDPTDAQPTFQPYPVPERTLVGATMMLAGEDFAASREQMLGQVASGE